MFSNKTLTSETNHRIEWIDTARGIGIILVIIGHIGPGILSGWIYSFHIPLFFLLSGMCFRPHSSYKEFLIRKIRTMVIPYFFLGIIMVLFQFFYYHCNSEWIIDAFIKLIVQRHYLTIWFIACLFITENLFYALNSINNQRVTIIISFGLFILGAIYYRLGGESLPWCSDSAIMAMPFMCVGFYGKELISNLIEQRNGRKEIISVTVFVILGIIEVTLWYINRFIFGYQFAMYNNIYKMEYLTLPTAFIGFYCTAFIAKRIKHLKIFRYLGQNSLVYFAWHEVIMFPIANIFVYELTAKFVNNKLVLYIEFILVVMILCTLANLIVMNTPLKVLVGKNIKNKGKIQK